MPMGAAWMQLRQTSCARRPKCGLWAAHAQPQALSRPSPLHLNCTTTPGNCHSSKKAVFVAEQSFFVCRALQMSHLQMAGIPSVVPCPGNMQCWGEKAKPRQEASLEPPFLSSTGTTATVCRKEARDVSDGDEMARGDCEVRHFLTVSRFAFPRQALLLF